MNQLAPKSDTYRPALPSRSWSKTIQGCGDRLQKRTDSDSHFEPSRQEFCYLRDRGADRRTETHALRPHLRRERAQTSGITL